MEINIRGKEDTNKRVSVYSRQMTALCSSPQEMATMGSFLMKKWLGSLSAKRDWPNVNTAPVSVDQMTHTVSRKVKVT